MVVGMFGLFGTGIRRFDATMEIGESRYKNSGPFKISPVPGISEFPFDNVAKFIPLVSNALENPEDFFSIPLSKLPAKWTDTSVTFASPTNTRDQVRADFFT